MSRPKCVSEDSKKKNCCQKCFREKIYILDFPSFFLESSETYAEPDPSSTKSEQNYIFLSKKKVKVKMKILLNEKSKKYRKIVLHTFQSIAHLLGPKTQFGHF